MWTFINLFIPVRMYVVVFTTVHIFRCLCLAKWHSGWRILCGFSTTWLGAYTFTSENCVCRVTYQFILGVGNSCIKGLEFEGYIDFVKFRLWHDWQFVVQAQESAFPMLEAYADGVEKCYIFLCLKPMQVVCRIVAKAQILRVCVTVCQTGFVSLTGVRSCSWCHAIVYLLRLHTWCTWRPHSVLYYCVLLPAWLTCFLYLVWSMWRHFVLAVSFLKVACS